MKTLRRLAFATTLATIAVIAIGGFVRASGSGDGCPDWPKCFGRWFPPLQFEAIVEYTHRYAGAIAIGLLLVTAAVVVARHRDDRRLLIPVLVSSVAILGQAGLGGFVVYVKEQAKADPTWLRWEGPLVTFHIGTAMLLIGALVLILLRAWRLERDERGAEPLAVPPAATRRFARAAVLGVFGLILVGAYVRGTHASLIFRDWPLMDGALIPSLDGLRGTHFAHRAIALAVGILVVAFAVHVTRGISKASRSPLLVGLAHGALVLYLIQVVVGGLQVLTELAVVPVSLHVLLSALIWSCLVAAAALAKPLAPRGAPWKDALPSLPEPELEPVPIAGGQVDLALAAPRLAIGARIAPYVALTKPRIIVLLLITTVPSMVLAAGGWPGLGLIGWTMLGGTLGAGAANAINMVIDRDIDAIMSRTKRRPLPSHEVTPGRALTFAMSLAAVSFVLLVATTNLLAAVLVQAAIAFYVFVYTLGLKRTTPQNIVIGGAAGAAPVLVGWAAVTGELGLEAWLLFAIVFAWTPPHFWALAIRFDRDYREAGIPMLPVVRGRAYTQRAIAGYAAVTVLMTAGLGAVARLGIVYWAAAVSLGAWFVLDAVRLWRTERVTAVQAMAVFKTSIYYLGLLFAAVAVDVLVR